MLKLIENPQYYTQGHNQKHFLGSVISAGASLLGGALGNKASAKQASGGQAHSDYQLQNRHQWEAEDLRKAGRNPILYSGSTPSTGSSPIANMQNPANGIGSALQGGTAASLQKSQLQLQHSQTQAQLATAQHSSASAIRQIADANLSKSQDKKLKSTLAQTAIESANSAKAANTWWSRVIRPRTKAFGESLQDFNPLKGFTK